MSRLSWCPRKHQRFARELLRDDGDEERLRRRLVEFALDTLTAASTFGVRAERDEVDDELPTAEEVLESSLRANGLHLHEFIPGRPTTALVVASGGAVRIGDDNEHEVVVAKTPVAAKVVSLAARGAGSSAVFAASVKELRMSSRFAPQGSALIFFVLRAEARVWVLTRGELLAVDEALGRGRKLPRFTRGPGGLVRVAMPRKPTGLDLSFPRVAPVR